MVCPLKENTSRCSEMLNFWTRKTQLFNPDFVPIQEIWLFAQNTVLRSESSREGWIVSMVVLHYVEATKIWNIPAILAYPHLCISRVSLQGLNGRSHLYRWRCVYCSQCHLHCFSSILFSFLKIVAICINIVLHVWFVGRNLTLICFFRRRN